MLFSVVVFSQQTIVSGVVTEYGTSNPIPYTNILLKNTMVGTLSDSTGHFRLVTKDKGDSLVFSAIGFYSKTIKITPFKTAEINIALKEEIVDIKEVKVVPDDGPVRRLLEKMIDAKAKNNPDRYPRYAYRKYTKWEYNLNNVSTGFINSRAFRNNQSVFKTNADSTKFLPIYFSEQLVYNEVQRNPSRQKSTVIADKTSGVGVLDDYQISGYTSALDMELNFYDNYIKLFEQNFVSPLAENGWFYYKYYLEDSTLVNGNKQYRIEFVPRRIGDKVFKGYMLTEDKNYSLVEIDGILTTNANLNFLKSMRLAQRFQLVNDSVPFFQRNQIDAVFDYLPTNSRLSKKRISLYFSQAATIDSVSVNQDDDVKLSAVSAKYETIKLPDSYNRSNEFWSKNRLENLSERDKMIYTTIDSVSNIKFVKIVDNIAQMSMTGYYDLGKFEFGPYMYVLNTNKVEGLHMFVGGRTSDEISTRYMIWGGLGYGTKNRKINGLSGFGYKFPTLNRQVLQVSYDDRIIRTGENEKILQLYENALNPSENNLVSQFLKRDDLDELYREQKASLRYEYEWRPGFINKIGANYIRQFSPEFYPFLQNGNPVGSVSAVDFSLDTRFSWKEKLIDDKFLRVYMSTDFPIIHLAFGGGKVYYPGGSNYYGRVFSTIKQGVYIGQAYFHYAVEGGIYFGKLPYTMLDIPRGNETMGYYSYDFNMLNYLEYVHDKYLHAYLEYHLNGFIFNRLPLLKRTGLREVISAKGMIGSLSDKHQAIISYPTTISKMGNPYIELGAGIENIFKLFRVEAIWRATPTSTIGAPTFGIRAKFEVKL